MSRVGKQPIKKPSGVNVTVSDDFITITGPKGELKQPQMAGIAIKEEDDLITVTRTSDEATHRARHGLVRSLVQNMVEGVSRGFEKKLEVNGVGYRVNLAGSDLKLAIGLSHEAVYRLPQGITANVEQNVITISGIDKQQVGQVAAEIRALKKPEPYKGKGIKYIEERILRKSGKSGAGKE